MWAMLTMEASEKALDFVSKAKPGATNEWLAARMLIEKRHGDPAPLRKELLARQNGDGGWAWLHGGPSDAFATGQALYALSLAGEMDAEAVSKAQRYLIGMQGADGSWAVDGLSAKPRPSKEPIYRYWGTAWAAIGLARTLPGKP
jgi:squalene-hopene/tetraprenyl-beta-curcumene cyclase